MVKTTTKKKSPPLVFFIEEEEEKEALDVYLQKHIEIKQRKPEMQDDILYHREVLLYHSSGLNYLKAREEMSPLYRSLSRKLSEKLLRLVFEEPTEIPLLDSLKEKLTDFICESKEVQTIEEIEDKVKNIFYGPEEACFIIFLK